jgi:UDP-N-acetylmuramoyl-L-alanyl-D-glutamate--2,6-diaminopimelate ligase
MARLDVILKNTGFVSVRGDEKLNISSVTSDSRNVVGGSLFIAVRGTHLDGHDYIAKAIEAGATAIICEKMPADAPENITFITVADASVALGQAASTFYDNPSSKLRLTGVTGTNGKTTIATLLYNMFEAMGYKCGLLSTVVNYVHLRSVSATHTTPDPVQLNKLLAEMVDEGCEFAFMEVSSHSIDQNRIAGLQFDGGIFTNLTHDHLDYHKTFDNYLAAKKKFFDNLSSSAFALVNIDDRNGRVMLQNTKASKHYFSMRSMAEFKGMITEQGFEGMLLKINGNEVWTRFLGDYNASNLLAVYGASVLLGAKKEEALTILSALVPVAGRMEVIRSGNGITGIVDYAHTPDAVQNVIEAVNRARKGNERLVVVVGAGGDRDKTKRPVMARMAVEGADRVILTSDNPRSEDPEMILDDMEAGIDSSGRAKMIRITNRAEAIKAAVMLASPGDIIIVAGKGHETYQEVKGVRSHFDDREELRKAFKTI